MRFVGSFAVIAPPNNCLVEVEVIDLNKVIVVEGEGTTATLIFTSTHSLDYE